MNFETEPTFQFRGTKKQREKLKQIFQLLLSVPAGYSVISGVVKSRNLAQKEISWVAHPRVTISFGVDSLDRAGRTDIDHNDVRLSYYDAQCKDMVKHPSMVGDITMASTLGHELRHVMSRYGYMALMMYAQTRQEVLLAKLLYEEDAYFMGDHIEGQLYANNDVLPVPEPLRGRIRKYTGEHGRLHHFKDMLAGNFMWARREVNVTERRMRRFKNENALEKTRLYWDLVSFWLSKMHIPVPLDEIQKSPILNMRSQIKSRPTFIQRLLGRGRA